MWLRKSDSHGGYYRWLRKSYSLRGHYMWLWKSDRGHCMWLRKSNPHRRHDMWLRESNSHRGHYMWLWKSNPLTEVENLYRGQCTWLWKSNPSWDHFMWLRKPNSYWDKNLNVHGHSITIFWQVEQFRGKDVYLNFIKSAEFWLLFQQFFWKEYLMIRSFETPKSFMVIDKEMGNACWQQDPDK